MTLQEAKEQVAKKYGSRSWEERLELSPTWEYDEAAELYARNKWDEACEAMKGVICDVYGMSVDQATKPEFKP